MKLANSEQGCDLVSYKGFHENRKINIEPTRLKSAQYSLHNNTPSSRKVLKMDVLTSETCWAENWHNKASVIKLVKYQVRLR